MYINFTKFRKIYFVFSGILILGSLISLIIVGLKLGIDFTGGSIMEAEYRNEKPSNQEIRERLKDFGLGEISIQPTGERGVILRMKDIDEETHQKITQKLGEVDEYSFISDPHSVQIIEEKRFESIGPTIGKELKQKTKVVVIVSLISMLLYIAFAFRKVSRPVKSWQYGIVSLFVLSHDILIPLGIFSILGKLYDIQITIPVVVALLTVVGYAINNVVVVFDRIRENLLKRSGIAFEETINNSLNETLTRQINTSLTTLFVLGAIFLFGGETLKYFALTLILGITAGTYSSIFLASPILITWLNWKQRK